MSNDPSAEVILDFSDRAKRWLRKMKKRDRAMFEQIRRKIEDIRRKPEMGSPKRYRLSGFRGVHVGPFVIVYKWDATERVVEILEISHHDHAYK